MGQYSITRNDCCTKDLRVLKVQIIGLAEPAKLVDTHRKWVIVWDQTVNATTYIFLTIHQNFMIMVDTSLNSLLASLILSTHESSNMIVLFTSMSHSDVTSYSPTTPSFLTFTCSGSEMQVLEAW
jgi:hypothetical protein